MWGVNPPAEAATVVTVDLTAMDRVIEIDHASRAARIQAGALGPAVEDQLRPHGLTLRHFPQSFEWSTVGGWIATRSGGHYATNQTHIDDFVESVRMLTPAGWWESRRLPGSGAGPSPDRLVLGSEGTLGIVSEAWLRLQRRPRFRATAGIRFPSWEAGWEGVRAIAQAKLWPANLRILDPVEAERGAGLDGATALVIVGFESADVPQQANIEAAVALARDHGGQVGDDDVKVTDAGAPTGRGGSVGAWRDSFVGFDLNSMTGLGLVADTFETAITWDRWPDFDATVRAALTRALDDVCGGGLLSCRFTHVYTDGPAPYYTFAGMGSQGGEEQQWAELKEAASEAVVEAGGTITHHHAVGRMHRPAYDRQRPDLFATALRAAKRSLDPRGLLNPGVLIDSSVVDRALGSSSAVHPVVVPSSRRARRPRSPRSTRPASAAATKRSARSSASSRIGACDAASWPMSCRIVRSVREATIGSATPSIHTRVRRPPPRSSPRSGSSA